MSREIPAPFCERLRLKCLGLLSTQTAVEESEVTRINRLIASIKREFAAAPYLDKYLDELDETKQLLLKQSCKKIISAAKSQMIEKRLFALVNHIYVLTKTTLSSTEAIERLNIAIETYSHSHIDTLRKASCYLSRANLLLRVDIDAGSNEELSNKIASKVKFLTSILSDITKARILYSADINASELERIDHLIGMVLTKQGGLFCLTRFALQEDCPAYFYKNIARLLKRQIINLKSPLAFLISFYPC